MNNLVLKHYPSLFLSFFLMVLFGFTLYSIPTYAQEAEDPYTFKEDIEEQNILTVEQENKEIETNNSIDGNENQEEPEIEQEEKRNILFIGDSYQTGLGANTNFVDEIKKSYGDQFGDIFSIGEGRYGFSRSDYKFIDLLQERKDIVEDKASISDIVITGGFNDHNSIDDVYIHMEQFTHYIKEQFPNAQLWLAPVGWTKDKTSEKWGQTGIAQSIGAWKTSGHALGYTVMSNIEQLFRNTAFFGKDGYHPNDDGQKELARCLVEELTLGSCQIKSYGFIQNQQGLWEYHRFGQVEQEASGIYQNPNTQEYYYLVSGVQNKSFFGITYNALNNTYALIKNGTISSLSGIARNNGDGNYYYVKNGVVDTSLTGIAKSLLDNNWYFVRNGKLDWTFTGVALSIFDRQWYHCNKGKLDWNFTGISQSAANGKWYFSRNGKLDWGFTGVSKSIANQQWYHCKNGELDWNFTGISQSVANGKWYFSRNGKLDWSFVGVAKSIANGQWYHCKNGEVDWTFTGLSRSIANGKWYFSENGKVKWNYTGGAQSIANGKWYAVINGELDWQFDGILKCIDKGNRLFIKGIATRMIKE